MKQYRKRFVLISMAPLTIVLLAVFTVLSVTTYYNHRSELENTMRHVLQPISGNLEFEAPPATPENIDGDFPISPDARIVPEDIITPKRGFFRVENSQIITVLVQNNSGAQTIVSTEDSEIDAGEITAAIPEVLSAEKKFGKLTDHDLIYYKETVRDVTKIALTQSSYLTQRFWQSEGWYFLIFLIAFGIFFCITVRLSKIAVRPMEQAMQLERRFVADVSHDLKTPITVILANNSIIKSNPDAPVETQMQWVESTDAAAKNMMHLIDEMLTLSSLDERATIAQSGEKSTVDLSSAAEKAELQLESIAFDRNITLTSDIQGQLFVHAASGDVDRICSSLLENALKYEPAGGEVSMTLSSVKKKAVLSIRNSNSFIAPEEQLHIFERFYRADKARDTRQGHGLGLPIIKQITDLIGASISVQSTEAGGTTFRVEFDLVPPPEKSH